MNCELISRYFPTLSAEQRERFAALDALYHDWNAKINVISRKDIDNLYEHHVLHSLGIAEIINFRPGTRVLDLGTGGGFPGIPLAILFPEVQFHLVDSIGKKIRVCDEVITALGLQNVTTQHARAEEIKYVKSPKKQKADDAPTPAGALSARFDFVVSRAVMPLADLVKAARPHIAAQSHNALPNGLIALKGGELEHEAAVVRAPKIITPLSDYFSEEYFQTKQVVYVQL
ncbi:MAG: 16S rRNA (guanine(527)-N(7))-methyltransferase RsmG [Bacteroidaceae bacterium]|nr:16S rRNA (guanine(527)-N(7))-methyltransferase RsmG [Bacteroidaceae bacterium]